MRGRDNSELIIGGAILLFISFLIFMCCDTIFGKNIAEVNAVVTNTYYIPPHDTTEIIHHSDPKTGRSWDEVETRHYSQEYHVIFTHSRWYYDRMNYWGYGRWNRGMTAPFHLREGRWTGIISMIPAADL